MDLSAKFQKSPKAVSPATGETLQPSQETCHHLIEHTECDDVRAGLVFVLLCQPTKSSQTIFTLSNPSRFVYFKTKE